MRPGEESAEVPQGLLDHTGSGEEQRRRQREGASTLPRMACQRGPQEGGVGREGGGQAG